MGAARNEGAARGGLTKNILLIPKTAAAAAAVCQDCVRVNYMLVRSGHLASCESHERRLVQCVHPGLASLTASLTGREARLPRHCWTRHYPAMTAAPLHNPDITAAPLHRATRPRWTRHQPAITAAPLQYIYSSAALVPERNGGIRLLQFLPFSTKEPSFARIQGTGRFPKKRDARGERRQTRRKTRRETRAQALTCASCWLAVTALYLGSGGTFSDSTRSRTAPLDLGANTAPMRLSVSECLCVCVCVSLDRVRNTFSVFPTRLLTACSFSRRADSSA
jgi:hypothetical protein